VLCFAGLIAFTLRDTSAQVGGPAPQFQITTDSGTKISPDSFGGRILVLNFWATWCSPCLEELPSLNRFQQEFGKEGVVVVGISIDKNEQKYHNFLKRIPVSFQTARDPKADISGEYGTFQIPETYIIKDGRVMRKYPEAEDWLASDITEYVRGIL
jgi:peroxiredoxin